MFFVGDDGLMRNASRALNWNDSPDKGSFFWPSVIVCAIKVSMGLHVTSSSVSATIWEKFIQSTRGKVLLEIMEAVQYFFGRIVTHSLSFECETS